MSELENIVHHIVQHEEERQAEKIKLESEIKALEEVLEHGISTKFVEEEVIYVYSPKTAHDMREKLEENYKQLHAQLTIPKSIADELDKVPNEAKRYVQENGFDDYSILDDFVELREFYEADEDEAFPGFTGLKEFVKDNLNLCALYLAGKALGVDFVKVV